MNKIMLFPVIIFFSLFMQSYAQIPVDKDVLLNAKGAGQAKYAENNGYPGPMHVLEMEKTLSLTADQKEKVQKIYDEMKTNALDVGKKIIMIEEELNAMFRQGVASEKEVLSDAQDIGRLRGKLRAIHLNAHLKTKRILNRKQIELYVALRSEESKNK